MNNLDIKFHFNNLLNYYRMLYKQIYFKKKKKF